MAEVKTKRATRSKKKPTEQSTDSDQLVIRRGLREGSLIGLVALCLYLAFALMSFDPADPSWSYIGDTETVANIMGLSGAWLADILYLIFGYMAVVFPLLLAYRAWHIFRNRKNQAAFSGKMFRFRILGLSLALGSATGLATLHFYQFENNLREGSGGILGAGLIAWVEPFFGYVGATLVLLSSLLFGMTIAIGISWLAIMDLIGEKIEIYVSSGTEYWHKQKRYRAEKRNAIQASDNRREALVQQIEKNQSRPAVKIETPKVKQKTISDRAAREKQGNLFKGAAVDGLPALHILDPVDPESSSGYSTEDLAALSRLLELKLKDYNVDVEVVAVLPGPVITRFEIQLAAGIKVSRITGLVKDLARSLAVPSVRVVEVIPGKAVVGIEIPNFDREIVKLSEVLLSPAYDTAVSPLSLALGHDIAGEPVIVDLAKMPHLLVAGTTGSGKSVGINAMILSLLFKASPEDVRLIMVDPKMLELAVYEGIPHLLTPVVTDMNDAANALRWCVAEMERRYRLMAALGVRNVGGFNRKVQDAEKAGEPIRDPLWVADPMIDAEAQEAVALETLPYIVVIIDEFADMMMIVGKKVEQLIARIAQKARAAGIHLILATQRPSVDVITGLIKANVPTRIAFQVSSKIDSRTILDQGGACLLYTSDAADEL
ncbi:MAG: DNA translocase FtsK 4TM domain-containing protein [Pseudomonadales bacterium]|nr:DNA translocase FtsK 4TM domain-containing protein [Pseudomonadales bacterium]